VPGLCAWAAHAAEQDIMQRREAVAIRHTSTCDVFVGLLVQASLQFCDVPGVAQRVAT
jgi:hypothetical protein